LDAHFCEQLERREERGVFERDDLRHQVVREAYDLDGMGGIYVPPVVPPVNAEG
jgi:hypothetical protein